MILISVKSPIVDDKRQFETDKKAMRFLLSINRLHHLHRLQLHPRPKMKRLGTRGKASKANAKAHKQNLANWREDLSTALPLRIEIINTKYNQLNLLVK